MNWHLANQGQGASGKLPRPHDPNSYNRGMLRGLNRLVEPIGAKATASNTHYKRKQTDRLGFNQTKATMAPIKNPKSFNTTYLKGLPGQNEPIGIRGSNKHSLKTLFDSLNVETKQRPKHTSLLMQAQFMLSQSTTSEQRENWSEGIRLIQKLQDSQDRAEMERILDKIAKTTGENITSADDGELGFGILSNDQQVESEEKTTTAVGTATNNPQMSQTAPLPMTPTPPKRVRRPRIQTPTQVDTVSLNFVKLRQSSSGGANFIHMAVLKRILAAVDIEIDGKPKKNDLLEALWESNHPSANKYKLAITQGELKGIRTDDDPTLLALLQDDEVAGYGKKKTKKAKKTKKTKKIKKTKKKNK